MSGLEKRAKRIFGTMPEFVPWDTAWLLSDGSWLRRGRGREGAAHHDMARTILDTQCGGHCVEDFTNATGAIRMHSAPSRVVLDILYTRDWPTGEQLEKLHQLCGPSEEKGSCMGYVYCYHMPSIFKRQTTDQRFDGGLREIADAMERCRL